MAIFNSYVKLPEGRWGYVHPQTERLWAPPGLRTGKSPFHGDFSSDMFVFWLGDFP